MAHILTDAALGAAPRASNCSYDERSRALLTAATSLIALLETGQCVESACLRDAMTTAFGGTDAEGAWDWKSAYDACEVAQILFLRRFGPAIFSRGGSRSRSLALIERVSALMPTHTRRSETSQALQQYSTPAGLSFVAVVAASIGAGETVLEPSAGTGMLAIQAELAGAQLVLNELAEGRAALLSHLFSGVAVSRHDAASIDDRMPISARPSVILMNPPFSAVARVERTMKDAALRHIASALARLENGGRLVVITGAGCAPDAPAWRDAFKRLQEIGRVVFTAAIDGKVYRKHGTTIDTRLTVIDKLPASDPTTFIPSAGTAPDTATLLKWVETQVPPRGPMSPMPGAGLHCRTRRRWFNPRQWPRSRRRNPPISRTCPSTCWLTACCPTPSWNP
jgi:predicted RNA methylase